MKEFQNNTQDLVKFKHNLQNKSISITDKIEILYKFSKSILDNIKDIEPEYSALVDEKFWDLL